MKMSALYKAGTEPTEVSTRYSTLDNPTNGSYTTSATVVNLNWNAIKTPDAIDQNALANYFNTNYGKFAEKYYEKELRIILAILVL